MFWKTQGLRGKVLLVLTLVALVPALLLSALGITAVRGLSGLARQQAVGALDQELRERLISRVQEMARTNDAMFQGVLSQAVSLGRYIKWYYDYPDNRPEPGYLRGGSALIETAKGHRVNLPTTPVGVFVSRQAEMTESVWLEVGALSFADPLLTSIGESTPGADRAWVISASRIVRMYPNQRLGHEGSPVGPDYDVTEDEPFQAAGPVRNPERQPVWTAPYSDPVSRKLMITAVAPIYAKDGSFKAVAGVDMPLTSVIDGVLQSQAGRGGYAFLLDKEGRLISAPDQAWQDLELPIPEDQGPGRPMVAALADSESEEVSRLAQQLTGAQSSGLTTFDAGKGMRYVAYSPLPSTEWVLCMVAPSEAVEAMSTTVERSIRRLEFVYLGGGALAVLLAMALAAWLANRASATLTRPVAQLVEGTQKLAADLTHRLPEMGTDELGVLAQAFNKMAASLEQSRAEAVRHASMVVEERNRLAREIHDTIAQGLTGIVVHLETAEDCLGPEPEPDAQKHLRRARQLARESLQEARRSVWNLRPGAVEERGIGQALAKLGRDMEQDGIACTVQADSGLPLSNGAEDALFRICQEALANVRRHSGASHVRVSLTADAERAILQVVDDGHGFDPAAVSGPRPGGGFGLWAMRERAEQAGGTVHMESAPGAGTTVTATVPLEAGRKADGAGDQGNGGR